MKKLLIICLCLGSLGACGKKGPLGAEDQIYPRSYPNPTCVTKTCESECG